jgi:uncharacterized protein (DUF433 family)
MPLSSQDEFDLAAELL